jgi:hypothetical protein
MSIIHQSLVLCAFVLRPFAQTPLENLQRFLIYVLAVWLACFRLSKSSFLMRILFLIYAILICLTFSGTQLVTKTRRWCT